MENISSGTLIKFFRKFFIHIECEGVSARYVSGVVSELGAYDYQKKKIH